MNIDIDIDNDILEKSVSLVNNSVFEKTQRNV